MKKPESLFAGKIIEKSKLLSNTQIDNRVYKKEDAEGYFRFLEKRIEILKDKLKAMKYH